MANAWIIGPHPVADVIGTADAGYDSDNLANDYAGVVWQLTVPGADYRSLIFDLGEDRPIDTVMLFGLSGFSAGTSVAVRSRTAAQSEWQARAAEQPVLAGTAGAGAGGGVMLVDLGATASARYVLVEFPNLSGTVRAARVVIGQRIALERNFSFGAGVGVKDLGNLEFSRRGVLLRARGAKLRTVSLTFSAVHRSEVEALTQPLLERVGNTECIALVTDPALDAMRQRRCYFGPLVGDLSQTWRRADAWEAKVNLVSAI